METSDLIAKLAGEAAPVRPLPSPLARLALWLLLVAVVLAFLAAVHGVRADFAVQLRQPTFLVGLAASAATGVLAALAALVASLPDRSRQWLLLPLPTLAVWVSTIGYGCLTDWVSFQPDGMHMGKAVRCFATLLVTSVPLSVALFAMIRHVARLRPTAVTMTAGLAVAALTATALSLFHVLDATIMILIWNLGVAALIVAVEGVGGRRLLAWLAARSRIAGQ